MENACASGGQAVLSVIQKLQLGMGDTGIAVGYEKMRDAEGKMDGKLIGKVLGYFSHPGEREGKVFVFPHIFAEVMRQYMDEYGVTEADLAAIPVQEYANAKFNPCAQMSKVQITLDQAVKIEGINRYVVDGLPLKTYDCSQITDGYASLILATEEGLAQLGVPKSGVRRDRRLGPGHRPAPQGRPRRAASRRRLPRHERGLRHGGRQPADVNVAEVHDCFSVMGALGTEVIGKAEPGKGAQYWVDGKARPRWRMRHQYLGRPDRQRPSHRRHRHRHDRLVGAAICWARRPRNCR